MTAASPAATGPLLDDQAAAALAGVVPLGLAVVLHFEDKGDQLEVLKVGTRDLDLLREYVADFNKSITHSR